MFPKNVFFLCGLAQAAPVSASSSSVAAGPEPDAHVLHPPEEAGDARGGKRRKVRFISSGSDLTTPDEAVASIARSAASLVVAAAGAAPADPGAVESAAPAPSRRYDQDFWGLAGGRSTPGRKARAVSHDQVTDGALGWLDNKRDRESCRALCSRLSEDELRCRLLRSRALKPKREVVQKIESGAALDDRWLEEAAAAFDVSPWYVAHPDYHQFKIRGQLKQEHLVELVMRAVQRAKCFAPGSKAAYDEERRARQLSDWEGPQKQQRMRGFAKKHGINPQCKKGEWQDFRRRLLIAGCPENLRLEVVSELVSKERRAPDPTLDIEAFAHDYLQSALGRRYLSSASGEQLSTEQVSEWQAVLDLLPIGEAPEWQEDPVLLLAKSFYDERGNLDVPKPNAGDEAEAAQLFQGLKVLRRAQDGDSRDAAGRLLRRRLTAHDVLRWEARIPRDLLWP